jgi:tRNA pseudouridine38-40 synthase
VWPNNLYFNPIVPTQRYKLTIAYRGTHYHGWQYQLPPPNWKHEPPPEGEGLPTVQQSVTRALAAVVNHPVTIQGSSRTDAGVHAKGQIAHFDTDRVQIPTESLRLAANHRLPDDILIRSIEPVPANFNAIRWTMSKRYQYCIWHHTDRPIFAPDLMWHRWQELDVEAMKIAARVFVGTHDFASFARAGHGRLHTIRTVTDCAVSYRRPKLVIGVEGTGFLWQMIRIMVGTLVEVGLGRYGADKVREMIEAKDRAAGGPTAPPHGLYLQWIKVRTEAPPENPITENSAAHPTDLADQAAE